MLKPQEKFRSLERFKNYRFIWVIYNRAVEENKVKYKF